MISLIAAVARNGVIGDGEKMPWHLPADLAYFKRMTLGKPVIMGRKTFESIGFPLPKRQNIVLTRDEAWQADGVEVVHSSCQALNAAIAAEEIMIIGGGNVYAQFMPHAERLYLTEVACDAEGETRFPAFAASQWRLVTEQAHQADSKNPVAYRFVIYERSGF